MVEVPNNSIPNLVPSLTSLAYSRPFGAIISIGNSSISLALIVTVYSLVIIGCQALTLYEPGGISGIEYEPSAVLSE